MSDKSKQQISNLMDGELEINASRFLLKRMASDKSLSQTWQSYHLIKSCLQKESQEPLMIDVAARVTSQLGFPQQQEVTNKPQRHKWLKPIMGIGIAASVAFMSVTMIRQQQLGDTGHELNSQLNLVNNNQINTNPVIKPVISAQVADGDRAIVAPPALLSRFPSATANQAKGFNSGLVNNANLPYIIFINQSANNIQLSPMKVKDVSD